jgi:hypothetical protein
MSELWSFAARSPDVTVLDFDAACMDPVPALSAAAKRVGLAWTGESETMIRTLDRPGTGWQVARQSARVPGAWRRDLPAAEVAEIELGLNRFEDLRERART